MAASRWRPLLWRAVFFSCVTVACLLLIGISVPRRYYQDVLGADSDGQERQASRAKRIRDVCEKYRRSLRPAHYIGFKSNVRKGRPTYCPTRLCPMLVDTHRKILFCFIPKVASTTVKSLFWDLLNFTSGENLSLTTFHADFNERVLRVGPTHFSSRFLESYTKAIFVRHPFDRLVSAYEDKANKSRSEVPYFYAQYWDSILNKSRENTRVTFPQFIDYLLSTPTRDWDEHWAPYYSRCEMCLVKYNLVGKLETGDADFKFLYNKLGVNYAGGNVKRKNERKQAGLETRSYFKSLTRDKILALYKKLFYDFQFFGYGINDFIT
ncbi:carbohydrate sulfotransferase 11-like [Ornithodoros turicata]|uniref:carbohydrate sulfotransferase 11-like n=1 Tax=Ornithodoros turicata TaxID=34597 RepID=UPI0031390A92